MCTKSTCRGSAVRPDRTHERHADWHAEPVERLPFCGDAVLPFWALGDPATRSHGPGPLAEGPVVWPTRIGGRLHAPPASRVGKSASRALTGANRAF